MLTRNAFQGVEELERFARSFRPQEVPSLTCGPYRADLIAETCRGLWLGVIWRAILDLQPGWDVPLADNRAARAWFEGVTRAHRAAFEEVCALAGVEPDAIRSLYRSGRLAALASQAIGRERWETRRANILARGDAPASGQLNFGF